MIFIDLVLDVRSDARDDVCDLARRTADATRPEKGCILYRFSTDVESPNRFVLTELWESEEDLKAYFAGEAVRGFWAQLPPGASFVTSTAWQGSPAPYGPRDPGIHRS